MAFTRLAVHAKKPLTLPDSAGDISMHTPYKIWTHGVWYSHTGFRDILDPLNPSHRSAWRKHGHDFDGTCTESSEISACSRVSSRRYITTGTKYNADDTCIARTEIAARYSNHLGGRSLLDIQSVDKR